MNPFKLLLTRASVPMLFMIVEIGVLAFMVIFLKGFFVNFFWASVVLSVFVLIIIINSKTDSAYKIAWMIPVLYFPFFGSLLYILYGGNKFGKRIKREVERLDNKTGSLLKQNKETAESFKKDNPYAYSQSQYINEYAKCPIHNNSFVEYYSLGELAYEEMLIELKKAEKYIFLEYFIIEKGKMWDSILEILEEKVREGVDVRLIYDDIGCLFTLPYNYKKKLESKGIKTYIFHPLKMLFSTKYNNRDHRKILVIDGKVAFTGGINLADEYINEFEKYGHWKDCAVKIKGDAVINFTILFLIMWEYLSKEAPDYDYYIEDFERNKELEDNNARFNDGLVQPFSDNPLDDESLGENVYANILGNASRYVYITTPYLVINDVMKAAICSAAKRGIDVRIIVPHIPDKRFVHSVSKSHYDELLKSNVRIYEYLPGFMHSKIFVSDDKYGIVGTINLDYRSLYLHYECGVWLYKSECIDSIKEDFLSTIDECQEITLENKPHDSILKIAMRSFLRTLSPLI